MFKLSNNIMVFTAVNYYYVSGMCSLYQLFQYKIGNASCGGDYQTLKELDVSAIDMMEKYKFCGDKQHTLLDLILNKISPALINKAIIGEIDICNSHTRSLTNRHKSLTRNVCAIPDCKNLAEIRNSKKHGRVTFELASTIFKMSGHHIFAGSSICSKHRKLYIVEDVGHSVSEDQSLSYSAQYSVISSTFTDSSTQTDVHCVCMYPIESELTLKRKRNVATVDCLESKLFKSDSENSSKSNVPDSQCSNFSQNSEVAEDKKLNQFLVLMNCLKEVNSEKCPSLSKPMDLAAQDRTLKEYASNVGLIWKLVLELVTVNISTSYIIQASDFINLVIDKLDSTSKSDRVKVSLALNVLTSIENYYSLTLSDQTRQNIATRKQLLQAIAGQPVKAAHQLSHLSQILGIKRASVEKAATEREDIDYREQIVPYLSILKRKSPEGYGIVSEEEKIDVISFYESDLVSDVLKGHNNVQNEIILNDLGEKVIFKKQKRVLKVNLYELLPLAQQEIGYKYSLRTLINLRPSWVLLSRNAHYQTCLCDRCFNITLILRCLSGFVNKRRNSCSGDEKSVLDSFEITVSTSDLLEKVLHQRQSGKMWHESACYFQTCDSTLEDPCGSDKLWKYFENFLNKFGEVDVFLLQHLFVTYIKVDGQKGTKIDQVETTQTIYSVVELLNDRLFGKFHKQPYIEHRFKMLLGSKMRKDIHCNLLETDVACYTDYSKELELENQEQVKSGAFGASNITVQLLGQVFELKVLRSSAPLLLKFNTISQVLTFTKPEFDGGSNIQSYEIHICKAGQWFQYSVIGVKTLSQEPEIPKNVFGRLSGTFDVRVYARNLSGLGSAAEITVKLLGDLPFIPKDELLVTQSMFDLQHITFYVEYFFFSDHNDAPKVLNTLL